VALFQVLPSLDHMIADGDTRDCWYNSSALKNSLHSQDIVFHSLPLVLYMPHSLKCENRRKVVCNDFTGDSLLHRVM
jgi:hypothetical protein